MVSPARNIEIKAKIRNLLDVITKAKELSQSPVAVLNQEDTFFNAHHGRLKLRKEVNKLVPKTFVKKLGKNY